MKRKQMSGSAKEYAKGRRPSLVWFDPEDWEMVSAAAKKDSRSIASFIRLAAIAAAKESIKLADLLAGLDA